jgi:3',5'-cyclic AMP phosphodiesterase CpdA
MLHLHGVIALLLLLAGDGFVLPDPAYAEHTSPADPARSHVGAVVHPTLGFPALVPYGGEVVIWLRGAAEGWKAQLRSQDGVVYPARVVEATGDHLRVRISARAPRDVYDLELERAGAKEKQPRAVRIYGAAGDAVRFALMADHQLWDPSWKSRTGDQHARAYPRRGEKDANRAMERQVRAELALRDPDFVLDAGDFVFGLDYAVEYEELYTMLAQNGFASFAAPGNHDGYAIYELKFNKDVAAMARAGLSCRKEIGALTSKATATWGAAFQALVCVYGGIKELAFQSLARDGLVAWRRTMGPPYYAFDHGPLHFVALDTYDGSPERRHAFAIAVDAFDLHLGAPAVDNYGGYLSDEQLSWLEQDLARAQAAGQTIVVFGHHDPRGNLANRAEERYAANLPFPTDPLSLNGFKEWQFDGDWGTRKETAAQHSGTRLCALLAKYATAYLSGHVHRDEQRSYEPGAEIIPGVRAEHHIDFVRVTAAAGAPHDEKAYWGYRWLEARGGKVDVTPYDREHGLLSVPGGNLWSEETNHYERRYFAGKDVGIVSRAQVIVNGLAMPIDVMLRWKPIEARPEGWRFFNDVPDRAEIPLSDVGDGGVYFVRVHAPGAHAGQPTRSTYVAEPAVGNHPPAIEVDAGGRIMAGQAVRLSAARTHDPDAGDGVLAILWTLPGGDTVRGETAELVPAAAGDVAVTVEAIDRHGARASKQIHFTAEAAPPPEVQRPMGCGCQIGSASGPVTGSAVILSVLLVLSAMRKRASRRF